MRFRDYLSNPHKRIEFTHFLVVCILLINIIVFTQNYSSILIQVILIVAVIFHNSDDKFLKQRLEETETQLREDANIFNKNIIVSESDLQGRITYVNKKFCKVSGYTEDELIGQPHSILRDPNTPKEFFANLWSTIQSGHTFHGILKNIKKNNTYYWIDTSISPIKVNSKIIGYKSIRFDITDKMLAKESLEKKITQNKSLLDEQSKRFEFAINSSRDGFWDFNVENQNFYLSSGWKKRLGFKENENVTYLKYLALIPDEYRIEHHNAIHDVIDNYPIDSEYVHFRIRYPLVTKAGEKLLIEDVGDAIFSNTNKAITRITGFHRDITEQERQTKMIETQNRVAAMGDMMGNIAHQWRQPIGAINNVLNDLELDIELEDLEQIDSNKFLEVSSKIKDLTAHLNDTINDFRDLTSNEKVKSEFMLKDVIEEARKIIESEYKKYNISFILDTPNECTFKLRGFKRELLQVIINILNNAKDILIEKKIQNPKIVFSLYKDNNNIFLSIHDNAGGISETIIEKIFDPYFTTKHESIGTGIGLFMSKKIIDKHFQGILKVINEDDGAKFIISLPIKK